MVAEYHHPLWLLSTGLLSQQPVISRVTNLSQNGLNPAHVSYCRMNIPMLEFCFAMIGRLYIEGSENDVAIKACPPQVRYHSGNFSDTSRWKLFKSNGSIGRVFAVPMRTDCRDHATFCARFLSSLSWP